MMKNNPEKIKITIVDDEKELVETVREFLTARDYQVSFAYDGKSGLEVVKKEKPDLIILDIMMPQESGRDMLIELKRDKSIKDIPVIMLTAKDEQYVRDYMLELGAYEYITKPYDSSILLRQIANVLDKTRPAKF